MIQRILIAVAGLGKCEEMFKMLMEVPAINQASVTILHVVPPQPTADAMSAKLEEGGKILASAVQSVNLDPKQVNVRLKQGDPKDVVREVAEEENSDLIIMGSRGLKRLESILKNSISQYVFQLTSRPMLLVKDDVYVKKIYRVMVAMDNSDAAKNCLKLALFLVKDLKGAQLFLVHVNPPMSGTSQQTSTTNPELDAILAPAAAEAKKLNINYRCITANGRPGEVMCRLADEHNIDLLMLGSPDRRPSIAKSLPDLDRLLGNSLSDYVRVHANCPVLLARTLA
jgi:nucleotide-binding universal stress UspA family protein